MDIEPLLGEEQIRKRIQELANQINKDFAGEKITVVGVLKGAFVFMADLVRYLKGPLTCDFLRMSSYDSDGKSTGTIRLEFDLTQPVEGKHVLLVEDIVDTGLTASYLLKHLKQKNPKTVKLCTFLHKPVDKVHVPIDYLGFEIPNEYVVGYGLDLDGKFRHLPYLARVINL
ncbi:MAG: hypoxanthine phosphoribosyltransferase [Deltaproteobacteria bacterium]|nr:hypoxanthine phosphoribosyltransferase [Deltaproteobacteria bacterium]MBI4197002.1 hypoxanthine phosphoribosyltransferase [Deltaproteobacteria bacterium]